MPARALLPLASLLFLLSGALGLGYQLVWIRKATLIVGASQVALATVVASFFLGLALGSLFVGRHLRSRRRSPLFVYGLFEAAIGVFALAFPWLFEAVGAAYGAVYPWVEGRALALFFTRFAILFVFFLLPTFFMGGTLPLLLDGLVDRDRAVGSRTSFLYGLNILGAVGGVLVTGYFAIPMLGMNGTSVVAGLGNLAIAAVALSAFRSLPPLHAPAPRRGPRLRLPVFFVALSLASGFAALGYQVAWVRYFGLLTDPSVHLTAVLLAVYLAALAVGSLLLSGLLARGASPLRVLALVQPLVPVLAFACLDLWGLAQFRYVQLDPQETFRVAPLWSVSGGSVDAIFLAPLAQVALVLFLPVVLLGTGLPALIAAATPSSDDLRASAGGLVFWNTVGSSAGSFAAGYLLIPGLGLGGTFVALGLVSLAVGVGAEWKLQGARAAQGDGAPSGPGGAARLRIRPGLALAALALLFLGAASPQGLTERLVRAYSHALPTGPAQLVELVEGPLTTAYVFRQPPLTYIGSGHTMLAIADDRDLSFQVAQGHLPALFYPAPGAPKRALGIALGSGQSFGALLLHPVEHIDVVDISPEIVDLSLRHFAAYNHGLGRDPRVRLHLDDGRHFVERAEPASYDVVSMEPPPPTAEGVCALYSLEFYRAVDRVLRKDGVLMQWLPLYRITPEDLRGIVKTQAAVFPHTFVVRTGSADFMVMSFKTEGPPRWSLDWLDERLEIFRREHRVRGHRPPGGLHPTGSRMGLLARLLTGPEDVARIEARVIYRDDRQQLSYSSGDRHLLRRYEITGPMARISFTALPLTTFRELQRYFREPIPAAELDDERARTLERYRLALPSRIEALERLHAEAGRPGERVRHALRLAALHDRSLAKGPALDWIGRALAEGVATPADAAATRGVARHGKAVFGDRVRAWIEALPPEGRRSPLVAAMGRELEGSR